MGEELLNIHEVARIFCTTPASIRTALWKSRKKGVAIRIPLPIPGAGELRWLRSVVDAHLAELRARCAAAAREASLTDRRVEVLDEALSELDKKGRAP